MGKVKVEGRVAAYTGMMNCAHRDDEFYKTGMIAFQKEIIIPVIGMMISGQG